MIDTTFPRQQARTSRFTLGVPRNFVIGPKGQIIVFARTKTGADRQTCLWRYEVSTGDTTLLVDPAVVLGASGSEELPPEEKARRERAREASAGIVRYSADTALDFVTFDLSGRLFVAEVATGQVRELVVVGPVVDARIDPTGRNVAYVSNGCLRVTPIDGQAAGDRALLTADGTDVTFGLAEFVAAEEMERQAGYWWSPDGASLLVARVDEANVATRYIADPANPEVEPSPMRYPAAGTSNALVSLHLVGLDGSRRPVAWDAASFEYLVTANWSATGLLVLVESRDQRRMQILEVEPASGTTTVVREDFDEIWLDIVPGVPRRLADSSLVWTEQIDDCRRLLVGDVPVTGSSLHLRSVVGVEGDLVLFQASEDPTEIDLWIWSRDAGAVRLSTPGGVSLGTGRDGTVVISRSSLESAGRRISVLSEGIQVGEIEVVAERPLIAAAPIMRRYGPDEIHSAVLFPTGHELGSKQLPVILSPYGGPHAQMVLANQNMYLEDQWFADQGFAVVIGDGHGTPGRGRAWDRSIFGDFATLVLADQVGVLEAAAAEWTDLDMSRVGIRGWSFGGYLAALAVLRRPDVFHAAVSGAPVTDWSLYDTHYTERYLGHPHQHPEHYEQSGLLGDADKLLGKLLFIHGLADDNVTVAHTLRLSGALLAAGRPHSVIPLSGVTHMTPQEVVAANRLVLEVEFFRAALG